MPTIVQKRQRRRPPPPDVKAAASLSPWWVIAVLAGLVGVVYAPAWHFPYVNWDDSEYVTKNAHVLNGLSWDGFRWAMTSRVAGNWHPLTMLSLMLDVTLFGQSAPAHHVINVMLHMGATVLLFVALRMMTRATGCSAFVAAIFGVHPLHVESVAWVSERKDVLSMFFVMIAICGYAWYVRARSWKRYMAVGVPFLLALISKPMVVTLPAVLLLFDVWPLKRVTWHRADLAKWRALIGEKMPLFAAAMSVGLVTVFVQGGAVASLSNLSVTARLSNAIVGYGRYLGKTFWPAALSTFYPLETYPAALVVLSAILLMALSLAAARMAGRWPFILTGWLLFIITVLPVSGLAQTGEQAIADRYMYFPLVGLAIAVAWGVESIRQRRGCSIAVTGAVAVLIVLTSAAAARAQVWVWNNSSTLWRHALAVNDRNYRAFEKLAAADLDAGSFSAAEAGYSRALALAPPNSPRYVATLENGLGIVAGNQGKRAESLAHFERAVQLNPLFSEAQNNLGAALATEGKTEEASVHYEKAVALTPDSAEALLGLAGVRLSQGRAAEALRLYTETVALAPDMAEARVGIAAAAAALGRVDQVYPELAEAIRLKPDLASARVRLANRLTADGRIEEAAQQLRVALSIDPNQAGWQYGLALLLISRGSNAEARSALEACLALEPNFPHALEALKRLGRK